MMKRILKAFALLTVLFLVFSCEEDLFFDDPRDKLTGEWIVDEDSELFRKKSMNRIYNVNISKDMFDSTAFYVDGFYELEGKVKVIMDNMNLTIPEQTIDGYTLQQGSGSISSDYSEMTFYYYVSFTGERDVVSANYTRPDVR